MFCVDVASVFIVLPAAFKLEPLVITTYLVSLYLSAERNHHVALFPFALYLILDVLSVYIGYWVPSPLNSPLPTSGAEGIHNLSTDVIIESIEFGESKAANELRMENNQN